MKPSDLTIVIPSLHPDNHPLSDRALQFCIEGLNETAPEVKKIIAFNGTNSDRASDKLKEVTKAEFVFRKEQGQCGSVNQAADLVDTKWLMVMNNDMVMAPGWFEKFTSVVENFGLLVASPNLVEPRKGAPPFIEKFCGGLGTEGTEPDFNKQCFLDFVEDYKEHENRPIENVLEDGLNLPILIRKDVWDTIGGYDTRFDPFGSNSDSCLQYRIILAGVSPKRVRNTLVYHFSQTSGTFHPDNRAHWEENRRYFKEKYGVERASSPEIWYKPSLEGITFHPDWEGKYATN